MIDPKVLTSSPPMAEEEVFALKQTLGTQLLLTQRLQNELEEERHASKSGSEEALSMILRLQKEKAEEKMEACQFKKMAEAKLQHAENSLASLEQVVFERDIQISSLKHQLKAFKQILRSFGISNADISKIYESLRFNSSAFLERKPSCIKITRQISMPSIRSGKLHTEINVEDGNVSILPPLPSIWRGNQLNEHQWQCVSDKSVIEIEDSNSNRNQIREVNSGAEEFLKARIVEQKYEPKTISENRQLGLEDESIGNIFEDDEIFNKALHLTSLKKVNSLKTNQFQADIEQLKCQMRQLSGEVRNWKQVDLDKGNEQTKLLRQIHEQLNTIQSHMKNPNPKKFSPKDEALFVSLTEAMLSISM